MTLKVDRRTARYLAALGVRLRELRLQAGMSQQALADTIGMSKNNLARLEHGRVNITMATLLRLAKGLAVGPHRLLPDDEADSARR